jgi:hypothetical protein
LEVKDNAFIVTQSLEKVELVRLGAGVLVSVEVEND